jgi:hypothetical protein
MGRSRSAVSILVLGSLHSELTGMLEFGSYRPNTDLPIERFKGHTRQQMFIRVMAETCGTYGGEKDAYRVLMGKYEGK